MDLAPPPEECEVLGPVPVPDSDFTREQNSHQFYRSSKISDSVRGYSEKMARNRLHYIRHLEMAERERGISKSADDRATTLARIVRGESIPPRFLREDRHKWRQSLADFNPRNPRVCEIPSCGAAPIPTSRFCFHHILHDKTQSLFVECPSCGRPRLRAGACLTCGSKPN